MTNNININLDFDATEFVNSSLTPIAASISKTVSSIFELTVGRINYVNQKYQLKKAYELDQFKLLLESDINSIPTSKLIEPNIAILGTTLEASKYYFEEEDLRKMFSKLVSSSMNKDKINLVRTSFSSIIQELNHIDALNLQTFYKHNRMPVAKYELTKVSNNHGEQRLFQYIFFSDKEIEPASDIMSASLDNLERLGLIEIDFTHLYTDEAAYKWHSNPEIFLKYTQQDFNPYAPSLGEFLIEKGIVYLTNLGQCFIDVCL